jgi:excisionase family DNA binding protein
MLLKAEEVAERLRVSVATVNRWAREGIIPSVPLPGGHQRRFRIDDVEKLLESAETARATS